MCEHGSDIEKWLIQNRREKYNYHKARIVRIVRVGVISWGTMRVDDAWQFLVFDLAKTGATKGEENDTQGDRFSRRLLLS